MCRRAAYHAMTEDADLCNLSRDERTKKTWHYHKIFNNATQEEKTWSSWIDRQCTLVMWWQNVTQSKKAKQEDAVLSCNEEGAVL